MNRTSLRNDEVYLNPPSTSQFSTELTCDACNSADIIETLEGYTCRTCGLVLEIQKMVYNRPYNNDIIQYAVLGTTQIGSVGERLQNAYSAKLEKLSKLQSIKNNKELTIEKARIEISRIFNYLHLPSSFKGIVLDNFKQMYKKLKPGTKFRSFEKLVPISIYFCLKYHNISIKESKLLEISKISKKDFNAFKLQILNFYPQYKERNRKEYILQRVLEISEHFQLGMSFYYQSKKILLKLWENIKNTSDNVIAGVVSSISILCDFKEKVTINSLCNMLGIKMSTIHFQIKKRIFERFNNSEFVSLVKSSEILKKIIKKFDLFEIQDNIDGEGESKLREVTLNIININLGNTIQVFNNYDPFEYYLYALKTNNGYPLFISLKTFPPTIKFEIQKVNTSTNRNKFNRLEERLFDVEFLKYYVGKDPPVLNHTLPLTV